MKKLIISLFYVVLSGGVFGAELPEATQQEMNKIESDLPEITNGNGQLCLTNIEFDTTVKIDNQETIKISEYRYKCINLAPGQHQIIAKREPVAKYDRETETTSTVNIINSNRIFMEYYFSGYGENHAYPHTFREIPKEKGLKEIKAINNRITDLEAQVHCNEDTYEKTKFCFSPTYSFRGGPSYNKMSAYLGINAKHPKINGPYIIGYYYGDDWLFLNRALDSDGVNVEFEENEQKIQNKGVSETFSLKKVKQDYLKKHIETGLDIKVYGKYGEAILRLPSDYIKAFFNYLEHNDL